MRKILFVQLILASIQDSKLKMKTIPVDFDKTQDMTTSRANTLFDDADDIQRQLDNEARDRIKSGKATSVWVFHFPNAHKWGGTTEGYRTRPRILLKRAITVDKEYRDALTFAAKWPEWDYKNQALWQKLYPTCAGKAQSPVDLPHNLLKVTGARELVFRNHDVPPQALTMVNDGRTVKLSGVWHPNVRPFIQGGAVHGRRYLFDSIHLHWPSEHTIGNMHYPIESQVLYVSVEYGSVGAALRATDDNMALLAVSNIYTIGNETNPGLCVLMKAALSPVIGGKSVHSNYTLSFFNPPFKEYASYQGSLTSPPCTESVVWLVRARSLSVTADMFKAAQRMKVNGEPQRFIFRDAQPLNDRNVYFFE